MTIFKNIYYRNEKNVNTEKYGLTNALELSKYFKIYDDLIDKMKEKFVKGTNDCTQCITDLNKIE